MQEPKDSLNPGDEASSDTPGAGEDACRACHGTGIVEGEQCTICGGTGKVMQGIGGG
jgi:RecJ-like exonuclease